MKRTSHWQNNEAEGPTTHESNTHEPKQFLKVRCPQCFQSYSVNASEIHQAKPKFACQKCQTKFWLPFPEAMKQEELIGFPISWLDSKSSVLADKAQREAPLHTEACSHCGYENPARSEECAKCGVVFENYKAQQEETSHGVRATKALRDQWQKVIADFYNDENHERFLLECQKLNNLAYASHRYRRLEEAIGPDDKILEMKERIIHASEKALDSTRTMISAEKQRESQRERQRPSWLRLSNVILLLSVIVVAVGYMAPEGRNLIGVGAATAFLALALRIYFKHS